MQKANPMIRQLNITACDCDFADPGLSLAVPGLERIDRPFFAHRAVDLIDAVEQIGLSSRLDVEMDCRLPGGGDRLRHQIDGQTRGQRVGCNLRYCW